MKKEYLKNMAESMVANNKGILAMDESNPTLNRRFESNKIETSKEMRRKYREMIVTTPGLNQSIGSAILYDETLHQKLENGKSFVETLNELGIIPGIKVDLGTDNFTENSTDKITKGLDDLEIRIQQYSELGLKFAKWRSVFTIGENSPTEESILRNAQDLAEYALICQQNDMVPIVEPEVLMDGNHDLNSCLKITEKVLKTVFEQLNEKEVALEGIVLKPNMILPGSENSNKYSTEEIADATVKCLLDSVPSEVPVIVFLSGGQSSKEATERLNTMIKKYKDDLPWTLSFSFSRALQNPSLEFWKGDEKNTEKAQNALYHRAICNRAATEGLYSQEMENQDITSNPFENSESFHGYPHYPSSQDIFSKEKELNVDLDDFTKVESEIDKLKKRNADEFYDELPEEKVDPTSGSENLENK